MAWEACPIWGAATAFWAAAVTKGLAMAPEWRGVTGCGKATCPGCICKRCTKRVCDDGSVATRWKHNIKNKLQRQRSGSGHGTYAADAAHRRYDIPPACPWTRRHA